MGKTKQPWHRGTHQARAKRITDAANANPATRCWRCGRTLAQHPNTKTGKRPHWQAGHVITGQPDGELRPEASTCNASHGATHGNRLRRNRTTRLNTSRNW